MYKKYLPIKNLFEKICFDEKYKNNEELIDELQDYLRDKHSRVYSWCKLCNDEKARITYGICCGYGNGFKRLKDIDKLVIEKQCLKKILNMCSKIEQNKQIETETLCIYERLDNIAIKRIELQITGRYYNDTVEGIIEIIQLNDEMVTLQKTINKHIHDIKNQLMMMLATANNIQKSTQEKKVKKYAYFIKDTIYSCNYMLSAISTNSKVMNLSKLFNMHHAILSMLDSFKSENDIEFCYKFNAQNPRIYANKVLITNVLYNVLTNAVQAIEHKGCVSIKTYNKCENPKSLYPCSQWLYIEITDDGIGIDEDLKDKIFDSYFTTKVNGSGLGLYSSKINLNQNNGTISFLSAKGRGTTFIIALPSHIE